MRTFYVSVAEFNVDKFADDYAKYIVEKMNMNDVYNKLFKLVAPKSVYDEIANLKEECIGIVAEIIDNNDMETFEIDRLYDVHKFFCYIIMECGLIWGHPDDSIKDAYKEFVEDEERLAFTDEYLDYLDKVRMECFEFCDRYDYNIYDVCRNVMWLMWTEEHEDDAAELYK